MENKDKRSGRKGRGLNTVGKRILVLTIAILMTFQFCTPTLTGVSFAEEISDVTTEELSAEPAGDSEATEEVQEEAAPQEEVTEPVPEETAEAQEAGDAPEEAAVEEQEEPAVSEEVVTEVPAAEEPAEEPAADVSEETQEEPAPEAKPEEVKYPEKTFDDSASGVDVHVFAPEGALPEGTEMHVRSVGVLEMRDVKNAVAEEMGSEAKVVKAVDITFTDADGNEVQPREGYPLQVSFNSAKFKDNDDLSVVHIDSDNNASKLDDGIVANDGSEVAFEADQFSIYAIVETGIDARILVKFMNGTTEIDSMYVKKNDDMEVVLYDPGVGTLENGVYFRGWTTDPDYTTETTPLSIEEVRTEVEGKLPPATDGTTVTYYAMLFKDYRITYLDENEISLGQEEVTFRADAASAEQSYKVNMGYTVQDDTHHFEGWNVVEGGSNIAGHTEGKTYQNNDEITITGDVTFGVNAPEGHWFVFDENGKGATYNAPQFVQSGDTPNRPTDANMIRNGYTFGGWFADKATADQTSGGTQYDFNQTLSDKTTVYARWIPKTQAEYTIIIWRQNVEGDGYDFVEAIRRTGNVGSNINTVRQQGTGNNAYAQIQRTGTTWSNVQYTGFHLKEFDQNVAIKTEGNSVLNVYYDRNQHTLQFQVQGYTYTPTTSNNGTQYGLVNGQYVQLTRHNSGSTFNPNYYWTYGNNIRYNGTRYTRSNGWETIKTITALYGQPIGDNFPIEGTNGVTYDSGERWSPQNSSTYNQVLIYVDTMPNESVTFRLNEATHSTKTITYYIEALPGETPAINYNGKGFVIYKSVDANYGFFTEAEDYINLVGFSKGGNTYPPRAYNSNNQQQSTVWNNGNARYVQCFYTRNVYPINFMDGKYVDGDENPLEESGMGQIGTETGIAYGVDVSSHNSYEPDAAHTPAGYVFEGWYIDDACTQPYTFTTMPEGGITVYAKWRQKQYRVFLHVNYPEGATGNINWGTSNQQLNFRISEGGHVSEPTGRDLAGYEFVGWYLDEACTQVFNGEAYTINEDSVTTPYDKTVDMTNTFDNNGNLIDPQYNSDLTGWDDDGDSSTPGKDRFWITKKLDIYAKWRSTLEGASGIVVEYDADGGTGAPTDTHTYVDGANAPAGAASKSSDNTKVFGYWEVQKWENGKWVGTGEKVFPGKTFTVRAAYAKVEDIDNPAADGDTKKYTVQLKAVYIDSEEPTPTHISWFKNDGTAAYHTDPNAEINVGVDILEAPTREGYEFLGWARVATSTSDDYETAGAEADTWEATSANWTQTLGESDLYLTYANGAYTIAGGTTVTQVAPDENLPFHAMFAVWEEKEVTITYAVAEDSTGMGTVDPTSEKVKAETGTATGSTATAASSAYVFDYWTVDDGTESISTDAHYTPSKENGLYVAHTYYAHFKLNEAPVTVHHYLKGTETKVAEDVVTQETIGTEINPSTIPVATEFLDTFASYTLTKDSTNPTTTVTVSAEGNEIILYYTLPLTITAKTDRKVYDAQPLTGEFSVEGALPTDNAAIVAALGTAPSITYVSESPKEYQAGTTGIPEYYTITNTPGTLTIEKRPLTITATDETKVYDGAILSAPAGREFTTGEGQLVNGDEVWTYIDNTFGPDVGSGPHTIRGAGIINRRTETTVTVTDCYDISYVFGTYTITPKEVVVKANDGTKVYDNDPTNPAEYTATVTGLVGQDTVTYTVSRAEGENVGEYTITPSGAATQGNYTVTYETGKFTITPATVTVKADNGTKVYDNNPENPASYTATVTGLVGQDTVEYTVSRVAGEDVGEYTITPAGAETQGNYTVTYETGTFTITPKAVTVKANDDTKVYDNDPTKPAEYTATVTGLVGQDTVEYTVSRVAGEDVDEYTITPAGAETQGNYTVTYETGTFTITPKAVTITVDNSSKVFNDPDPEFTGTVEGLVNAADLGEITYSRTNSDEAVGTYEDVLTASYTENSNYTVTVVPGDFEITINKTLTVTAVGHDDVYDGNTYTASATAKIDGEDADGVTIEFSTDGGETWSTEAPSIKDVGEKTVTVRASKTGYETATTTCILKVTKRPVTIEVANDEKVYGENDPTFADASMTGQVQGELTDIDLTVSRTNDAEDVGTYEGVLAISKTKAELEETYTNYTFTVGTGDFTIKPKAVTVKADNDTKVYDNDPTNPAEYTATVEGLVGSDTISYTVNREAGENVGDYTITPTGAATQGNYTVTYETGTFTITKASMTVKVVGNKDSFVYNGSEQEVEGYTLSCDNTLYDETEVVFDGEAVAKGTAVGTYPMGLTEDQFSYDNGNIDVTFDITDGELKITESTAEITVTTTGGEFTYDGQAHGATVTVSTLPTGYTLETATSSATATHVAEGTVAATCDTLVIKNAQGVDVTDKLDITYVDGTIKINPATLTIVTQSASKEYDGEPLTAPGTISGFVNNETATFEVVGTITEVGTSGNGYTLTFDKTAVATDYTVSATVGTLTVTESTAEITVTTTGGTFTYDGQAHGATVEVTGVPKGYTVVTATSNDTATHVAEGTVAANCDTLVIQNAQGVDVTENLDITYVDGTIKINPATLTVTTPTQSKVYDGTALTAEGTITGFVNNETATFTTTGTQTAVGTSDNTYTLVFDKTAVATDYNVQASVGKLTVTESEEEITVTTTGGTFTYDGQPHGATVTVSTLPTGYTLETATSSATATDVTTTDVPATCDTLVIRNAAGEDVTENLNITYVDGTIKINPAPVTITTGSGTKPYDGTALTNAEANITGLVEGEGVTLVATGSQTEVGSSTNTYSITWNNAKATNYTVTEELGTLTVTENTATVTLTAASDSKTYDGTPLTNATVTASGLPEGFTVEATASGSQTVAGESANVVNNDYVIKNAAGEDKTDSFTNVTKVDGTLTVTKKDLTITAGSDTKVYDGTPLTKNSYTSTALAEGDSIDSVTVTGSQTVVGSSDNVPSAAVIKNAAGADVTASYNITYANGTLEVTNMTVTITADSDTKVYDGTALTKNSYTNTALAAGDRIDSVTVTGSQTNVGTSDNVPSAAKIVNAAGEDVTASYTITYADGTLEVTKKAVTITADSASKVYDGTPLTKNSYTNTDLAEGDRIDSVTVTGSQTNVGSSDNVPSAAKIVNAAGTDVTENYEITYVNGTLTVSKKGEVVVTITEHSGTETYDGTEKTVTGYDVSISDELYTVNDFTFSGNDSVSGTEAGTYNMELSASDFTNINDNFENVTFTIVDGTLTINKKAVTVTADSDTKVYDGTPLTKDSATASGLATGDALDSVTVTGSQTVVGSSDNVPSAAIIKNAAGKDVTASYTITYANGTLEVTQKTVTITAESDTKVYDGTPLTNDGYTNTALAEGDRIDSVTVTGSQTVVGSSDNVPSNAKIVNAAGADVTSSYTITYANGTLEVTQKALTITAESDSKVYDGTPLTNDGYTNTALAAGDSIDSVTVTGSQTVVGTSNNVPSAAKIVNAAGDDVTSSYSITYANGTLAVTQKALTITAESDSKVYDGTPLTNDGFEAEGLAEGDEADSVTVTGSQTVVGTSNNVPSEAKIVNAAGEDVTASYSITYVSGTLEVTKKDVTITGDSATKVYDGTALTKDTATPDGLASGDELDSVTLTGSQLNVGSSANVPSEAKIVNAAGADVTSSYNITYANGTLTVTPVTEKVTVTITGNTGTATYDGTEKTVEGYTVSIDNDLYTENDFTFSGDDSVSGTTAGEYPMGLNSNDFENISDNFTNVEFVVKDGSLTINARALTITAESDTKVYDGTPLTNDGFEADDLAEGDKADSVTVTGSQLNAGSSDNVPSAAKIVNAAGEDVTSSYDIEYVNGTLTITPVTEEVVVTITGATDEAVYDGSEHSVTGYTVEISNDLYTEDDFEFSGNDEASRTEVFEGDDVPSDEVKSGTTNMGMTPEDFKNISENFTNIKFVVEDGSITIDRRPITLTSASDEKPYDGTPLTNDEVTISGDGLAPTDELTFNVTGSQTLVGESENTFIYTFSKKAEMGRFARALSALGILDEAAAAASDDPESMKIAANYEVTEVDGTLTVTDTGADPDDVLTKTHEGKTFKVGETITFTIEVTNIYEEVKTITLTELEGVTLEQSVFEDVEPGAVVTTTATYTVTEEDALAGTFKNTVTAEYSGEDEPFTNEDEVKDFAHMTVEKKVVNSPADGKAFRTGETIKYEITVTNDGTKELTDIVVKDELTGDEWKIDSLAAGKSKTFKAEYLVTEKDGEAGSVTNVATAEGTDPDGDKTPGTPGEVKTTTDKADEPVTPKTGDTTPIVEYSVIFGASIITLLMMLFRRKKERA